jgi:cytidylate kinase
MNHSNPISVITFDGPAGTGKGTISQLLAKKLGWHYLDSGAMFRILAYAAIENNVELDDDNNLAKFAKTLEITFKSGEITLFDKKITKEIRTENIAEAASKLAILPGVRNALADKQRSFYHPPGLIADGRDMGTVIFPNAILKFFLDASAEERAKRRHLQLKNSGADVSLALILKDLHQRDMRDRNRAVSPLKPAEDAFIIDTTALSIDEVFATVIDYARKKINTL